MNCWEALYVVTFLFYTMFNQAKRAIFALSLLFLILCTSGCTQGGVSKLFTFGFDGIGSITENADGTYVLNWPAASNASGILYTVYQANLPSPELYPDGIVNSPTLQPSQMPASSGSDITTLSTTELSRV